MATRHVIALDLGGTKLAGGLVAEDGTIAARTEQASERVDEAESLRQMEAAIEELMADTVVALGVGIPSQIDQRTGRVESSVHVPLADVVLRDRLAERFGLPVWVDNDANAAAVAEHRLGAGRGTSHMIMLTLGTGLGGGLILNGALYRGATGAAGELGHVVVDIRGREPCLGSCPGFGHLEAIASGTAAAQRANAAADANPDGSLARARADGDELDGETLVVLAHAGEEDALELLTAVGHDLGEGLVSFVNAFNPELVVVGGGFGQAGELLLDPARQVVAEEALPAARDAVRIVQAELGPDAGVVGAALLGFDAA
jgi:glucokinase